MYQRDYILRLIEQFAGTLRAIRDRILRRDAGQPVTQTEIHELAAQVGLDLDLARRLDPGVLLMWLSPTGDHDPARLWLMAELLYLAGLVTQASGDAAARGDFERALAILRCLPETWRPSEDLCTVNERMEELRDLLTDEP